MAEVDIRGRTVLCFGDSNTHGTPPMTSMDETRRFDPAVRWPGVMRRALPPDWTVIEEGHPGRTTVHDDPITGAHKNGLRALPVALETHRPIDLVILMLGTNDFQTKFSVTALDIALAHKALFGVIAAKRALAGHGALDLLIVAPPPVREVGPFAETFAGAEDRSARLAGHLEARARDFGAGFLDAGRIISVCDEDGIHFDAAAHATLGAAIAEAVRARLG